MEEAVAHDRTVAQGRVRILMVDDRPENLLSTRSVLDELGEDLVGTTSAFEAVNCLLREDFGLILLDVMMPEMDGFELARQIRRLRRSRHTPIIFLTAAGRSEDSLVQGYKLGAVDYLVKPVVPEILRAKVAVFVQMARQAEMVKEYTAMLEGRNAELRELMAEQRQAEAEILRLNKSLKARVGELSELNAELETFSQTVSHDLHGPLLRIEGFSRRLREECGQSIGEEGSEYLRRIEAASRQMGMLIGDLLALARSGHCEMKPETVDLSALAMEMAGELRARPPERTVDWQIAAGVFAYGDARLLAVALRNLLENAWKYTARAQTPHIEFGARTVAGAPAYFVADNGMGFKVEQREELFQPFRRLPAAREMEGTGIGLAIVSRIVARHGGRVWAEGEEGVGATFYFELPPGKPDVD